MKYRKLGNTGMEVSVLSFGASSMGGVFHEARLSDCIAAVHAALDGGINFIDVSPAYGATLAETNLGKALQGVPRECYYLATKVGSYHPEFGGYDYSATRTVQSVHESLIRLGVDYFDLVQCHDIEFADQEQIIHETLPALETLRKQGIIRHIGITGLPLQVFVNILDCVKPGVIDTILSFCHYELNDNSLATLIPYLKQKGVGIINAAPTGMGLLTERGVPEWHPASQAIKDGALKAIEHCKARGVDIVKLAIQYSCANRDIATTLVSTTQPKNIRDNIAYVEEAIDEELLAEVLKILEPIHNFNFNRGRPEHHDPILG